MALNVNRPGSSLQTANNQQIGTSPAATSPSALHIEQYSGEVHGTLDRISLLKPFFPFKPVKGGSQVSNFRVGSSTLQKLTPGDTPVGTYTQASKNTLTVDTVILAREIIPMIDDFQNSYDYRSEIGKEHGKKLARYIDEAVMIQAIKASQLTNAGMPTGWNGGTTETLAALADKNDPAKLYAAVTNLMAKMEEKDVDPLNDECILLLKPTLFYKLVAADELVDATLVTSAGNNVKTKVWKAFGLPVFSSNNYPGATASGAGSVISGHYLSNAGNSNAYDGDFSKVLATIVSPQALLGGETIPVTTDVQWDFKDKVWYIDAYTSFGVTPDRPAFSGSILVP